MPHTDEDLLAIQAELERVLEERMTSLLGHIKACQEVTAQIATSSLDIRHQDALHAKLEAELKSLTGESTELESNNADLKARLTKLRAHVEKMKNLRAELMSGLSDLSGQLGGE